jgi:hypothetical protein
MAASHHATNSHPRQATNRQRASYIVDRDIFLLWHQIMEHFPPPAGKVRTFSLWHTKADHGREIFVLIPQ